MDAFNGAPGLTPAKSVPMPTEDFVGLSKVMDLLLDAICVVDKQGCFVFVSAGCQRIFGYTPAEMIGRPMIEMVFPEDRARTLQTVDEIVGGQPQPHFENRYVRKDGEVVHIMWSARWSEADQVRIAVARDITERKRAESLQAALYAISEAAHTAKDLPTLFQSVHRIVGALLPVQNFQVVLFDADKDELSFSYFVDQYDRVQARCPLASDALCAEVVRSERALLLTSTSSSPLAAHLGSGSTPMLGWLGVPLNGQRGVIGVLVVRSYSSDVRYGEKDRELLQFVSTQVAAAIERKQLESWLQHLALHDKLTGLPNRELFQDRLEHALALARRDRKSVALFYLDLDRFKQVNDTYGHAVGDLLLQEVAARLKLCVRESDTIGRIGGDEFLVLLNGVDVPACALKIAEKIRLALSQVFDLSGRALLVSPSIGVALYPEHGDDYKALIQHADEAMYVAKKAGGNCYRLSSQLSVAVRTTVEAPVT